MSTREYTFDAKASVVPLVATLPPFTTIRNKWPQPEPKLKQIPPYVTIATASSLLNDVSHDSNVLMGKPIHVIQEDVLQVILRNSLPGTGLSLHWHGFEMNGQLEYDGVVGITQCPISPYEHMTYNFTVNETPGTYWYHTHSGNIGINAINVIKGPLIVHPKSIYSEAILDSMKVVDNSLKNFSDFRSLIAYENERILFFSDHFLMPDGQKLKAKAGGLNPSVSKNDDGFTVGTFPFDFGTCNGKLREVIHVAPGKTYKFRLLNAGTMYAFRIQINNFPMMIVAADSEKVKPYEVDEVILHAAERFDVEIKIPSDIEIGSRFWIRADTLESEVQGSQNGIRAILHVTNDPNNAIRTLRNEEIMDPPDPIVKVSEEKDKRRTMNCYSKTEGKCYPLIQLKPYPNSLHKLPRVVSEVHFIDMHFSAPPLHAHFVRIDNGKWKQHVNPTKSHFLNNDFTQDDLHRNTAMLHLPSFSPVIIVWRTTSMMDHPIHLHGYKMEILDIFMPDRRADCTRASCRLSTKYDSPSVLEEIDRIPSGNAILKDTFIIPAGGAVVTRIQTKDPAVWFAHCHLELQKEDGMAMIFNIGNYTAPLDSSYLPDDFPSCEAPFVQSLIQHPSCTCYQNSDAVLNQQLTSDHLCSRDYLCMHEFSYADNLGSYNQERGGISMRSKYTTPNYIISIIVSCIIGAIVVICIYINHGRKLKKSQSKSEMNQDFEREANDRQMAKLAKLMGAATHYRPKSSDLQRLTETTFLQKLFLYSQSEWENYRPGCVNITRVAEVSLLGLLVGILFYDVGNDSTAVGLSQKISLLFFSVTLWTFTRMYPSVGSTHAWFHQTVDTSTFNGDRISKIICAVAAWVARIIVSILCEGFWPFLHVFLAYPLSGMFGRINGCFMISFLLAMNNLCYVALGSVLGVLLPSVPLGMNVSTVVSQTTLVAAGFYTTLPPVIHLIRIISPVFWTFSGILKSVFRSSDTFKCVKGQSDIGANYCYIEFNLGIDLMKRRGISIATWNDPHSESITQEVFMLCLLYLVMNLIILVVLLYKVIRTDEKQGESVINWSPLHSEKRSESNSMESQVMMSREVDTQNEISNESASILTLDAK